MKAFVRDRYGSPDILRLEDVPMPDVGEEQVLVRVRATSVNALDWHLLRGKPYLARLSEGLRRPKLRGLGVDAAGTVEEIGAAVSHLRPGDRVFGSRRGAFGEYVSGKIFVAMPQNLGFEEAAAVPTAAQTALQAVRDHGELREGQRVLVNGAGGGVGTFAVQIAKALGGEVTAVTRAANAELLASIGADEVIDHERDDFTRSGRRWGLVVDVGGNHSLARLRRVLTADGTLVVTAPAPGQWIGPVLRMAESRLRSRAGQRVRSFLATPNREDLLTLKELIEAGKVRPVVDRIYRFDEVPDAIRHVEEGRARGKVVIRVRAGSAPGE